MRTIAAALAFALTAAAGAATSPTPRTFDARAAWSLLRMQVALGPRSAGTAASRRLALKLRQLLPNGRFEPVPGGLRNVIGVVRGRDPSQYVVVGAHYDTKQLPHFVGANDGASGVAVVVQLARTITPRELRPTVVFVLFDGEEEPPAKPDTDAGFFRYGDRGSHIAARRFRHAEAMVLLDMVGDRDLAILREASSDPFLWSRLRSAAAAVGTSQFFPAATTGAVEDDQTPFERVGVPAIDVIDATFPCWHRTCDDLRSVAPGSLRIVGSTVLELLRRL